MTAKDPEKTWGIALRAAKNYLEGEIQKHECGDLLVKLEDPKVRLLVGRNVKFLRTVQGLTGSELEVVAGLSKNLVGKFESGVKVNPRYVLMMAATFKVLPHLLFREDLIEHLRGVVAQEIKRFGEENPRS